MSDLLKTEALPSPVTVQELYLAAILAELQRMNQLLQPKTLEPVMGVVELREPMEQVRKKTRRAIAKGAK